MPGEALILAHRPIGKESTRSTRRAAEGLHHSGIPSVPSQAGVPFRAEDAIVRNKANLRRSFKSEVASVRQAKPNCESFGAFRFAKKRLAASLRTRRCRAKRSQLGGQGRPCRCHWVKACQTKPISARTTMGQSRQDASAAGGANRAKQSQFSDKRFMGKELRHAGSPGGFCETKPIPAGGHRWTRAGKVAQAATAGAKRAKQSQFSHKRFMGKELRHVGSPRGFCETKPISAGLRLSRDLLPLVEWVL